MDTRCWPNSATSLFKLRHYGDLRGPSSDTTSPARYAGRAKCRFLCLEALLAQIDELDCGFASNVIVDRGRDANAARLRDALQPRGDVNAIYKKMSCGSTITSPMLTPTRK